MSRPSTQRVSHLGLLGRIFAILAVFAALAGAVPTAVATTYYVNSTAGNDRYTGQSPEAAWQTLACASKQAVKPGDQILLHAGSSFHTPLKLSVSGTAQSPITISRYGKGNDPIINAKGYLACIHLLNADHVRISHVELTSDAGQADTTRAAHFRYGVLVEATDDRVHHDISIEHLKIHDIFASAQRKSEGKNPTSNFGFGIAVQWSNGASFDGIKIAHCDISRTGFTAIHLGFTRSKKVKNQAFTASRHIQILDNTLKNIGGPGIQPSATKDVTIANNVIDHSGAYVDPRMHGRGSGIWPFGSTNVTIEDNTCMHARGKGDSCGIHIDFNCRNVIVQRNLSIDNAGGFIEVLGNDYNCTYRYNLSINDGFRTKHVNGAQQDGHTLFISPYSTVNRGPYDIYIYNNTIYNDKNHIARISITPKVRGLLIQNNIFLVNGKTKGWHQLLRPAHCNVYFQHNLINHPGIVPHALITKALGNLVGNPVCTHPGGLKITDYIPTNTSLVRTAAASIQKLPGDSLGILGGFDPQHDILGRKIVEPANVGAIQIK